ncbi:hypothetical protein K7X08_022349 [Anisodus acutangulus]|uniref:Clp R domain-containing protein n=1 Tax=Anisodus acutangulus TaxID=402998 RepID=A0A9Q1RK95_9SOLA|nr:hypothetical protein K7X08_022349 [Anisodus acutangulus]
MPQGTEAPISNALMAALKRAQAHQRRGCPEQQQQPLLAVKVELEQLIISILDDPSVSRVMREASFSSPAVKATIEQSLTQTSSSSHQISNVNLSTFTGMGGSRILTNTTNLSAPATGQVTRNMYLNPKLQGGGGGVGGLGGVGGQFGNFQKSEEVKKVLEILLRSKKRNPVLVGEGEPESVAKELFGKIEKGEFGEGVLKNLQVLHMEKEFSFLSDKNEIPNKIKELGGVIDSKISSSNCSVILDLGDLKWLVEQQQQQQQPMVSEIGKLAVAEMGKLIARFRDDNNSNRLWLIGTATCETYLRCQIYHSTMENDWDLQAVPIASRSPHPGIFPRLGNERILGSSLDPLNPMKSFTGPVPALLPRPVPENLNPRFRTSCCPQCKEKFEHELAKLVSEFENSLSDANKSESPKPQLPQWLQSAKLKNDSGSTALSQIKDQGILQQKTQELQKKWNDTCLQLHPNFQSNVGPQRTVPPVLSMPGFYNNPNLLLRQPLQPKLVPSRSLGVSLQLNTTQTASKPLEKVATPPGSPVRTDLVLGQKPTEKTLEDQAKNFLSCISSVPQNKLLDKFASALDADTFKMLLKGLMEKAWWQQDASSSVASAVSRCRLGNGKPRGGAPKGDIWLLFTGPDRYAKRKMASVLAEQMCGNSPIMICLGSRRDDEESDLGFRGKTAVDRIAEAVRRNPLSVVMLEDIDEANLIVRGNIKKAMDRGRLTDSHGREISLGNVIFILTGNWSTMSPESYRNEYLMEEKKLVSLASSHWQLRLTIGEKSSKRRASWLHDEDRPRKELNLGLSFDLNEAADFEDYRTDGSFNSSDLTVEHEVENRRFSVTSVPHELVSSVDDTILFKPIEFLFARREIKKTISKKFSMVVDDKVSIEVEDDIVDRILGGLWRGRTSLEQWVEKVLGPSFDQILPRLSSSDENAIVRLQFELHTDSKSHNNGECLPSNVTILADGQ